MHERSAHERLHRPSGAPQFPPGFHGLAPVATFLRPFGAGAPFSRPSGARQFPPGFPRACARGYIHSPLRGWRTAQSPLRGSTISGWISTGLRPWLHSLAPPGLSQSGRRSRPSRLRENSGAWVPWDSATEVPEELDSCSGESAPFRELAEADYLPIPGASRAIFGTNILDEGSFQAEGGGYAIAYVF